MLARPNTSIRCVDTPDFVDHRNHTCADWASYDCSTAMTRWGYTETEMKELYRECCATCTLIIPPEVGGGLAPSTEDELRV